METTMMIKHEDAEDQDRDDDDDDWSEDYNDDPRLCWLGKLIIEISTRANYYKGLHSLMNYEDNDY